MQNQQQKRQQLQLQKMVTSVRMNCNLIIIWTNKHGDGGGNFYEKSSEQEFPSLPTHPPPLEYKYYKKRELTSRI